jgi:signal transduction histidine kinase
LKSSRRRPILREAMTRRPWTHLRELLDHRSVAALPLDVPDEEAFAAYMRAASGRNLRMCAVLLLMFTFIAWGVDPLVHWRAPETVHRLAWLRAGHAALLALYLALRLHSLPRYSQAATLALGSALCVGMGWTLGLLGDLTTPWFHFVYVAAIAVLVPVVTLWIRALYGVVFAGGVFTGFALARPLDLRAPMLLPTLAFLLLVTTALVAAGDLIFRLVRRGFQSERARGRAAIALEELNRTLEQRVREQTQELRLLAAHLERAREDERLRIARELHDELGQELTALRYTLTFLRQRFEREPASIRPNLDELESLVGRTAATTRQILSDLRPRILDDLGLDASVEWLLKRTEERAGLTCRLVTACRKLDVDVEISIAAFRILQESLTNVVRHARAKHVDVEVSVEEGELRMSIRDDGVGMPAAPPARIRPGEGGMGLIGMRERVGALGGKLRVESSAGAGTVVRVELPMTRPRAALEAS